MEPGEDKGKGLGGSLPVENVQALASNNLKLKDIPLRYIRPEIELGDVSVDESLQIPVIDMAKLVANQLGQDEQLLKLHLACKNWGFFQHLLGQKRSRIKQLINHGIAEEVIEKMKIDMQEFFKLPLDEKMKFGQVPNSIQGYGQAFVVSEEQKLDWGDMLFVFPQPVHQRQMRFWPTIPTSFRTTLDKYSSELQNVTISLLRLMAKNLGIESDKLASMFHGGTQAVRMNYYPPCAQADKVMGLAPHSDATGLTLLIQVNEVQGLQVRKKAKWVPVKPIPGAFIVNIGDIMEIMSNGEYKSIEHRAVVDPEKARLSIAAFHGPNMKTMIAPLPDLVKEKISANYKTVSHKEYIRLVLASKLDGKRLLDRMKVCKSHL